MVLKRTGPFTFEDDDTPNTIGGPGRVMSAEDYQRMRILLGLPDLSRDGPTGSSPIPLPKIRTTIGGANVISVRPPVQIPQVPIQRPPVMRRPCCC